MDEIIESLFDQLQRDYLVNKTITDEFLLALNFVFPTTLLAALDLLDKRKINLLTSKSGRSIYQVIGSSGSPYLCFLDGSFCECPAFRYSVLRSGESVLCKHLLALKISHSLDCCKVLEVSEDRMSEMLKTLD